MGLFASRPEEPFEWAGIPSEPLAERSDAELLETPPVDPFAISTGAAGPSISISVSTVELLPGQPPTASAADAPDPPAEE